MQAEVQPAILLAALVLSSQEQARRLPAAVSQVSDWLCVKLLCSAVESDAHALASQACSVCSVQSALQLTQWHVCRLKYCQLCSH